MELTVKVVIDPSEKMIELFSMLLGGRAPAASTATPSLPIVQVNPTDTPAVGVRQVTKNTKKDTPAPSTVVATETVPKEGELSPSEQVMADKAEETKVAEPVKPEDQERKPITFEELRLLATAKSDENKVVNQPLIVAWLRERIPADLPPKLPNLDKQYFVNFKHFLQHDLK